MPAVSLALISSFGIGDVPSHHMSQNSFPFKPMTGEP